MRLPARATAAAALAVAVVCAGAASVAVSAPAHADASSSPDPVDTSTLINPTSDSALLNLLGQQGVSYIPVTDPSSAKDAAGRDSTLVIDAYEHPTDFALSELISTRFGRVVILNNEPNTLNAFMPEVGYNSYADAPGAAVNPSCSQADAVAAGSLHLTERPATFVLSAAGNFASGCYPIDGHPTFAYARDGSADVAALGSAAFFENDELASAGNAALALRLFGAHRKLVWFAPSFTPDPSLNNCSGYTCDSGQSTPQPGTTTTIPPGAGSGGGGSGGGGSSAGRPTLTSLMPSWIWWALLQLLVALLLVAYWRGRRLGAVVTEQLPVTVRAAETVEGHARLYHRANAHGRAAELLRRATASRLAGYFGVPAARAHADPSLLVAPVAARLNLTEPAVAKLLTGGAPESEAELVLLADHLDQLEQEVRSS